MNPGYSAAGQAGMISGADKPVRESEVLGLMGRLEHVHQQLAREIDVLVQRLNPVLEQRPSAPPVTGRPDERSPASPLGLTLLERTQHVESMVRQVATLNALLTL